MVASCRYQEQKLRECSKRGGVVVAHSFENARSGPENIDQATGSEREGEIR